MSAKEGFVASEGMMEIADEFQNSLIHIPAHHFRIFKDLQLFHVPRKETKAQREIIYPGKTIAKLGATTSSPDTNTCVCIPLFNSGSYVCSTRKLK